jgi:hypothetical protein
VWAALLLFTPHGAAGQAPEFNFSGYALTLPVYSEPGPGLLPAAGASPRNFLDLTRARLRPSVRFGPNTLIMLEHETDILLGSPTPNGTPAASVPRRQLTALSWTPVNGTDGAITHSIDRLYLREEAGGLAITLGRQRIAWGTGRVWNPTDLFNPINPADYSRIEKSGADAASFKWYAGEFTDVELVWNPEDHFRRSNFAARARTNVLEFDLSAMGGRFDGRTVVGGDFAGNAFGSGVRGECLLATGGGVGEVATFILGADYQFTPTVYGLVEYLRNGGGSPDTAAYDLAALASGRLLQLGKNYLYASATIRLHPVVSAVASANANLDDGSGFVFPQLSWSALSNLDVSLGALLVFGKERSEYRYYNRSLFGRLTGYF